MPNINVEDTQNVYLDKLFQDYDEIGSAIDQSSSVFNTSSVIVQPNEIIQQRKQMIRQIIKMQEQENTDIVKNFEIYFPHNNISAITSRMIINRKKSYIFDGKNDYELNNVIDNINNDNNNKNNGMSPQFKRLQRAATVNQNQQQQQQQNYEENYFKFSLKIFDFAFAKDIKQCESNEQQQQQFNISYMTNLINYTRKKYIIQLNQSDISDNESVPEDNYHVNTDDHMSIQQTPIQLINELKNKILAPILKSDTDAHYPLSPRIKQELDSMIHQFCSLSLLQHIQQTQQQKNQQSMSLGSSQKEI